MSRPDDPTVRSFLERLEEEYARRFPVSRKRFEIRAGTLLDDSSHAIRWNEPFMPIARRAEGAAIEDLDGHRIVDYWQGHFTNILGHNPPLIRDALVEALGSGHGLQSGMLHEIEWEVADLLCRRTRSEVARLTTSGSLATFYAAVLARAFTGREIVLKVSGGWHGSQPFGLKGVAPQDGSFDHLESEGLSSSTTAEVLLTRFNDVEDLRSRFDKHGDRIACFLLEPMLGAGGGMAATVEYLREARRLTEKHGALLLCDEIITAFRFHAGDLCSTYGIRPDLLILGKVIGGGMPVSALAGRRDVLELATRRSGRVKFEGGTYSAHELSLIAAKALLHHLIDHEDEIYPALAERGRKLRAGLARVAEEAGVPIRVLGLAAGEVRGGSLVYAHLVRDGSMPLASPEDMAEGGHPRIGERLLKATLLLEDLSTRSGIGAVSTAHTDEDLERTFDAWRAGLRRFRNAGLV